VDAVRTGPGVMPSYSDQLSDDEIEDVAVSEARGGRIAGFARDPSAPTGRAERVRDPRS
jgi:mono/diheme cytochrome c family protein